MKKLLLLGLLLTSCVTQNECKSDDFYLLFERDYGGIEYRSVVKTEEECESRMESSRYDMKVCRKEFGTAWCEYKEKT